MSRTQWSSEHEFTLDGVSYSSMANRSSPDQMVLLKPRPAIEAYEALIEAEAPRTIFELGIFAGGSTALFAQLARPTKLVAIDHNPAPCAPLERFLDEHDLRGTVVPLYGVDQADAATLERIVDQHLDGGPLDLVVDDASHLEPQTRASFNRLFPHVRPGGAYLIEDWSWPHVGYLPEDARYRGVAPLSALVCELVIAAACRPNAIAEVTARRGWALVRRGPAALDPERFDVATAVDEVGRDMVDRLLGARTRTG